MLTSQSTDNLLISNNIQPLPELFADLLVMRAFFLAVFFENLDAFGVLPADQRD